MNIPAPIFSSGQLWAVQMEGQSEKNGTHYKMAGTFANIGLTGL